MKRQLAKRLGSLFSLFCESRSCTFPEVLESHQGSWSQRSHDPGEPSGLEKRGFAATLFYSEVAALEVMAERLRHWTERERQDAKSWAERIFRYLSGLWWRSGAGPTRLSAMPSRACLPRSGEKGQPESAQPLMRSGSPALPWLPWMLVNQL